MMVWFILSESVDKLHKILFLSKHPTKISHSNIIATDKHPLKTHFLEGYSFSFIAPGIRLYLSAVGLVLFLKMSFLKGQLFSIIQQKQKLRFSV